MIQKRIKYILIFIGFIYTIHIVNVFILSPIGLDLRQLGIKPRTVLGLIGIPLAPLLHGGFFHLFSNTIPLFILLLLLTTFYENKVFIILTVSVVLGGFLVWLFGRGGYVHIGASGLIYSIAAFMMVNGFIEKNMKSLLLSIAVIFLYGGLIWGVFPTHFWVSWEGHLFGAIAGVICAFNTKSLEK
jgi:membrane associated rhomboid family serine protease